MKAIILGMGIIFFGCHAGICQPIQPHHKPNKALLKTIDKNLQDAVVQYTLMSQNIPAEKFPKTFYPDSKQPEFSNSNWWCSGFYPGTLFLLYSQTNDTSLYTEGLRMLALLQKEEDNKNTHDLGFMMYNSFGNANLLYPSQEYKKILMNSAQSLSTRFNATVGCIKSWNAQPNDFLVIIDNMMNLKLLFWATQQSGDSTYYKMAETHAITTMLHHFRDDNSSYHVLNYDANTGAVLQKKTQQGFANESAWGRGQAWGLYGYTETFRETRNTKFLEQANKIATYILNHPNFPADKISYWDFNAPNIPNALRDASAAAITASALLELSTYVPQNLSSRYFATAETILTNLSSPKYKAANGTNGGFLLKHSVGYFLKNSEVDVPLTYADYYFVEAMIRYKKMAQ